MKRSIVCVAAIVGIALGGCSPESARPVASGKGTVRAINAIPGSPQILFRIEERQISGVDYKGVSAVQQWDDLEYTFNFDAVLAGRTQPSRIASQNLEVVKDMDYTFLVSGSIGAATVTIWERGVRTFDENATVFDASFAHTAASLGALDVYFAAPGIPPAPGAAVGTIAFGEILSGIDFTEGEYAVTYTTAGDHTNVVFASDGFSPAVATSTIISVFDGDENELGPVTVRRFNSGGGSARVADASLPPRLRFFNASLALGPTDIYSGEMLETLLVENLGYGEVSPAVDALVGTNTLTFTTPMDTSVILFEGSIEFAPGTRADYVVVGGSGALGALRVFADRRSVITVARVSFLHAAVNHSIVDIYLLDDGTPLADAAPRIIGLPAGNAPVLRSVGAGSYDVYVTGNGAPETIIAGPFDLDLALGDVVELAVLDNPADTAIADIIVIPAP